MANDFKDRLTPDERMVGNWISVGNPAVVEVCAHGFDFAVFDLEHTPLGLESLENSLRAVDSIDGDVSSVVRVPWNDPIWVKRVLDLGPDGLIIPMVESEEEARNAVEAMQYPPDGVRGLAVSRASDYGRTFEEYVENANDELVTIVQIESEKGVENAEEIVAVDGVDAVLIGHGDLSASYDMFGEWESEQFESTLESIIETTHDAEKPVMMLALEDDDVHSWVEAGADSVIAGVDIAYLAAGSDSAREAFDAAVESADE